jgi:hypothetical protein
MWNFEYSNWEYVKQSLGFIRLKLALLIQNILVGPHFDRGWKNFGRLGMSGGGGGVLSSFIQTLKY